MAPAKKKAKAKAKVKARKKSGTKAKAKAKTKKGGKKAAVRKKAAKKAVRKTAKKRSSPARTAAVKRPPLVEPGPPIVSAPPVEEPASREEAVGIVTHYYSHLGVAVIQVNKGTLRTGDQSHIKGHTSDITQIVGSMEYEHQHVDAAEAGKSVGLKVVDHVREHDIVYLIK